MQCGTSTCTRNLSLPSLSCPLSPRPPVPAPLSIYFPYPLVVQTFRMPQSTAFVPSSPRCVPIDKKSVAMCPSARRMAHIHCSHLFVCLCFPFCLQFRQYQALFEGYTSGMWTWYSAVVMWKTASPWPALRGALYDSYLATTGGLWGVRAGKAAPARKCATPSPPRAWNTSLQTPYYYHT